MRKDVILKLEDNYKLVAISDIHAHLKVFESLMDQLDLKADDYLIIIGDFINKGPNSLSVIRRMMDLSKRPNTTILKGNHEYFVCQYLFDAPINDRYYSKAKFFDFISNWDHNSILKDFCIDQGMTINDFHSFEDLQHMIFKNYSAEVNYMNDLPVVLHLDDMVFVHGGYCDNFDPLTDESKYLKYDDFNKLSTNQDKTVVVGHWPTSNMRSAKNTNKPLFNNEKGIISIDGGLGVKSSGELNALIIEKQSGQREIHYIQENHFQSKKIIHPYVFNIEDKIFVNYPHFDLELIEKGEKMTKCRHVYTGKELSIFNSLLDFTHDHPQVITTYINHFLNLEIGETVELVMTYDDCALVKHNGEFGWVWSSQLS